MCLSVVATGNHYVFDIVAGLAVSAAGLIVGPLPERWLRARRRRRRTIAAPVLRAELA